MYTKYRFKTVGRKYRLSNSAPIPGNASTNIADITNPRTTAQVIMDSTGT